MRKATEQLHKLINGNVISMFIKRFIKRKKDNLTEEELADKDE